MVDPNTGTQMPESDNIISYLYNEYGDGNVPLLLKLGPLTAISNSLALLPRCFLFKVKHSPFWLQKECSCAFALATATLTG